MKRAVTVFIAFIVLIIFPASSFCEQADKSVWGNPVEQSSPEFQRWFFSFGIDYRTDEREYSTVVPSLLADLIVYSGKAVAFNAGIGYNHRSLFDNSHHIRTFLLDVGIRVQDQRKLFSPFLETGFQFTRYEENDRNTYRSENRRGIFFSLGLSARIDSYYLLDIKLKQSVNHINPMMQPEVMALPDDYTSAPEHVFVDGPINQSVFGEALYNATTLEMMLRIPL